METEQLVGAVRHLIAQRQGLMYLDEALSKLMDADIYLADVKRRTVTAEATLAALQQANKGAETRDSIFQEKHQATLVQQEVDSEHRLTQVRHAIEAECDVLKLKREGLEKDCAVSQSQLDALTEQIHLAEKEKAVANAEREHVLSAFDSCKKVLDGQITNLEQEFVSLRHKVSPEA
jgi:hypothetical protein